jgi:hypothetical protein
MKVFVVLAAALALFWWGSQKLAEGIIIHQQGKIAFGIFLLCVGLINTLYVVVLELADELKKP